MLNKNVKELLNDLGYLINEDSLVIDKEANTSMKINITNNEIKGENACKYFSFDNDTSVNDAEQKFNKIVLIDKIMGTSFRATIFHNGILVDIINTNESDHYSIEFSDSGIVLGEKVDNVSYLVWNNINEKLTTNISEEKVLDIFGNENLLTILKYYSDIVPEVIDSIANLTQHIISNNVNDEFTRKLKINE